MPTYEYVCTSCGHRLEAVQSFSDPALITCPVCQGALRKVFGNVGIVLKGSGFYKNDSRSTGRPIGSYGPPLENKVKGSTASSDSGSKDSGSKDSGSKDSGSKDSGSKDSHAAPAAASSGSSEKAAASKV
jgi:putative FmdB family regulatory protein